MGDPLQSTSQAKVGKMMVAPARLCKSKIMRQIVRDSLTIDDRVDPGLGCDVDRVKIGWRRNLHAIANGGARVARKAMVQRMGPATASRVKAKMTGWKCRPFTSLKLDFRYTLPTTKLVCTAATASWQGSGLSPKRPVPVPTPAPASHDVLQVKLGNQRWKDHD